MAKKYGFYNLLVALCQNNIANKHIIENMKVSEVLTWQSHAQDAAKIEKLNRLAQK